MCQCPGVRAFSIKEGGGGGGRGELGRGAGRGVGAEGGACGEETG